MSQNDVNKLMDLWSASLLQAGSDSGAPFANVKDMHDIIDEIKHGDAPWYSFTVKYSGVIPDKDAPKWMTDTFEVCARDTNLVVANLLKNTDFDGEFEYSCYCEFDANGKRQYCNFMSGEFAERQSVSKLFVYSLCPKTPSLLLTVF